MNKSFQDHFSSVARRYADFRPGYPTALFDFLAGLVPPSAVVWDCACGSGQATADLARRFSRVMATDASAEQIGAARAIPNVDFRVAPAEQSGLPEKSAHLITVAQALHWFDLTRFYAEARRVLQAGGWLAAWAYGVNHLDDPRVETVVQDFYADTLGPYWPPERKLVEDGYRTLPFPFSEATPPPLHMQEHWTLDQLLGYFSSWSATQRFIEATGRNPLDPLREALGSVWGDSAQPRRITWPLAMRLGRISP